MIYCYCLAKLIWASTTWSKTRLSVITILLHHILRTWYLKILTCSEKIIWFLGNITKYTGFLFIFQTSWDRVIRWQQVIDKDAKINRRLYELRCKYNTQTSKWPNISQSFIAFKNQLLTEFYSEVIKYVENAQLFNFIYNKYILWYTYPIRVILSVVYENVIDTGVKHFNYIRPIKWQLGTQNSYENIKLLRIGRYISMKIVKIVNLRF